MRYSTTYLFIFVMFLFSCTKSLTPQAAASLNVVNAAVGIGPIQVNTLGSGVIYSSFPSVNYGSNSVYTLTAGSTIITIVPSSDTLHPIVNTSFSANTNAIYSLFLLGNMQNGNMLVVQDTIPYRTDSTTGVRFVNLSSNSNPISVSLSTDSTAFDFSNLAYKQISGFKTYPALSTNTSYEFLIKDAATDSLITTYTLTAPIFYNCTLALIGLSGMSGPNAQQIVRINNY